MLNDAPQIVEKAKEFLTREQLDYAETELLRAIEQKLDTNEVYFLLGDIYLRKNDLKKAEGTFKKAISIDFRDYLSCLNLGNICLIRRNFEAAEKYLSLVLEHSNAYRDHAISLMGELYFEQGKYYEAYHCFEAALRINPDDENIWHKAGDCLMKKGMVNSANQLLKKALQEHPQNEKINHLFISLEGVKESINSIAIEEGFIRTFKLLKQYYPGPTYIDRSQLNEIFAENYKNNLSALKRLYPHLYEKLEGTLDKLDLQIIPLTEELHDFLLSKNGRKEWMYGLSNPLELSKTISSNHEKNTPVCLLGMAAGYELKSLFQLSSDLSPIQWEKIPVYVVEPSVDIFKANLMLDDLTAIFNSKRIFFFLGKNCLEEFYQHLKTEQVYPPERVFLADNTIADMYKICFEQLKNITERKQKEIASLRNQINTHYNQMTEQDWQKIFSPERNRPLRILGLTSRFSTFLQYCMRDVMDGFRQLGCEIKLLIENSDVSRLSDLEYGKALRTFTPDLIFLLDHNRTGFPIVPKNIPCVTWIQDVMPEIFNSKAGATVGTKDFFLVLMSGWLKGVRGLYDYGYPHSKLKQQIIPANEDLYKPVSLTSREINRYGCDVSFVKHGAIAPEQCLESLLTQIPDNSTQKVVKIMYEMVRERFFREQDCFKEDYLNMMPQAEEAAKERIKPEYKEVLFYHFYFKIGDGFIRQLPIERIARMGVNLKLFGKDWEKHPRLTHYACGPVENGAELNKLFNATKINLQLHLLGTTNQRFVEGAAAGGFFLVKHLKKDEGPLSHHYQEGEEFVFFHSLDELEQKISYYLDHEEERKRIGLNAHRKTLEKYTYKCMCKEIIEIIAKNPKDISL